MKAPVEQGELLRAWMQRTGISRVDLAQLIDVSGVTVWRWLNGRSRMPCGLLEVLLAWEHESAPQDEAPRQCADLSE
jgi:transcriptional regulator with XRE-family HTH domain